MKNIVYQNNQVNEDRVAHLTDAAYQAVLQRGFRGSFLELELSLWNAIRAAVEPTASPHIMQATRQFASLDAV